MVLDLRLNITIFLRSDCEIRADFLYLCVKQTLQLMSKYKEKPLVTVHTADYQQNTPPEDNLDPTIKVYTAKDVVASKFIALSGGYDDYQYYVILDPNYDRLVNVFSQPMEGTLEPPVSDGGPKRYIVPNKQANTQHIKIIKDMSEMPSFDSDYHDNQIPADFLLVLQFPQDA